MDAPDIDLAIANAQHSLNNAVQVISFRTNAKCETYEAAALSLGAVRLEVALLAKQRDEYKEKARHADEIIDEKQCTLLNYDKLLRDYQRVEREAWIALGTTKEKAEDDPDTANLADSIRISLEYERDKAAKLNDMREEIGDIACKAGADKNATLVERVKWLAGQAL